jgi:hypothetical protein
MAGATHGFEICDTFTRRSTGLRAQQALLLENEGGSNEETADDGQDYPNDLEARICRGGASARRAGQYRRRHYLHEG